MLNNILIVSPNSIKNLGYISENYDDSKLNTLIKSVQDLFLEPALGSKLYNKILEEINKEEELDIIYKNLIDGYIIYAISNFVKSETIIASYDYTNSGVIQRGDDKIYPTSLKDLQQISNHYRNIADSYVLKMQLFIKQNIDDYPQFNDNNNNAIKTDKTPFYVAINL